MTADELKKDGYASAQGRTRSSSLSPTSAGRPISDTNPQLSPNVGPSLRETRFATTSPETSPAQPGASVLRTEQHDPRQVDDTLGSPAYTSPGSSSRPSVGRTTSAGRSRQQLQVTTGRSRARPHNPRRKSGTPKSPAAPNIERSPRVVSEVGGSTEATGVPRPRPSGRGPPPGFPPVPSESPCSVALSLLTIVVTATTSGPVFALPSASSWQSVESMPENFRTTAVDSSLAATSDLVNRDFRGKFAETQKKLTSSTNLAALGRMRKTGSVVRFADEVPPDLRKGKERESQPDDDVGPSRLRSSLPGGALSDGEDSSDNDKDNRGLPRTKSQLSLLIKKKREETGSRDIGSHETGRGRGMDQSHEDTNSKEEELLLMARRDGVTKAGGVQGSKPQRMSEHEDPGYLSSSSPEPLF